MVHAYSTLLSCSSVPYPTVAYCRAGLVVWRASQHKRLFVHYITKYIDNIGACIYTVTLLRTCSPWNIESVICQSLWKARRRNTMENISIQQNTNISIQHGKPKCLCNKYVFPTLHLNEYFHTANISIQQNTNISIQHGTPKCLCNKYVFPTLHLNEYSLIANSKYNGAYVLSRVTVHRS